MEGKNHRLRLVKLEALDKRRLQAQQKPEWYQARLAIVFNKNLRPHSFQIGDQVLALKKPIIMTHKTRSKFAPKREGPYVVHKVYSNDAYMIVDAQGVRVGPTNNKFLKHYYP